MNNAKKDSDIELSKRNKKITIRVSSEEHVALQKLTRKPRLAEWMREYCLGVKLPRLTQLPPVDPSLLRQLAGIGNNINQIARAVNSKYTTIESIEVIARLTAIERDLDKLRAEFTYDR